jgi:nucleoside-diphosphate-sugar epimerase
MKSIVVFGGSGFVGTNLVPTLLNDYSTVFIADIKQPCWHSGTSLPKDDRIVYVSCDVRRPIERSLFTGEIGAIVNLAAVHTSPGHPSHEYFEANILGAKNICAFAEATDCERIVFTSSISVYGPGEDEKNEELVPMPAIPYGSSKIVAEYIHREWFNAAPKKRTLTTLRPGVIFGKGEGGNFTRIANALEKGFFSYPGRNDTVKACLYVKDICAFIKESIEKAPGSYLYNFCYPQKVSIKEIVTTFKRALGYKAPEIVIPYGLIASAARVLNLIPHPAVKKMGLVPERIVKLIKSTNISSKKLVDSGYKFGFTFEEALKDWSKECGGKHLF